MLTDLEEVARTASKYVGGADCEKKVHLLAIHIYLHIYVHIHTYIYIYISIYVYIYIDIDLEEVARTASEDVGGADSEEEVHFLALRKAQPVRHDQPYNLRSGVGVSVQV